MRDVYLLQRWRIVLLLLCEGWVVVLIHRHHSWLARHALILLVLIPTAHRWHLRTCIDLFVLSAGQERLHVRCLRALIDGAVCNGLTSGISSALATTLEDAAADAADHDKSRQDDDDH